MKKTVYPSKEFAKAAVMAADDSIDEEIDLGDSIDDLADTVEDLQDTMQDDPESYDGEYIQAENNISNHYIAECDRCNGVFISAVVDTDQEIDHVSGTCPICQKNSDQYLKWIIKDVDKKPKAFKRASSEPASEEF